MRTWFKYDHGYVNIDSKNLYLTNTGNWAETKELDEKRARRSIPWRKLSIYAFLMLVSLIVFFLIIGKLSHGTGGLAVIVSTTLLGYRVYDSMKSELGAAYRIPKGMISSIEFEGNNATIHFTDGSGLSSSEMITGIQPNGLENLEQFLSGNSCEVKTEHNKKS